MRETLTMISAKREQIEQVKQSDLEYNIFMSEHQTYSLTTILNNNQLQPEIYHHMIHGIKSPIQEQELELTNDNSVSYERAPRRPNIPPPPPKSPLAFLGNEGFSRTYESVSMDLPSSKRQPKEHNLDDIIESVVSPLDYEVNVQPEESGGFCGRFDSILKGDIEMEIEMPLRSQSYKRKPIFSKQYKKQERKPTKSLEEAKQALLKVDEAELACFLQFMGSLEVELRQIDMEKIEMQKDLCAIYQRLSVQTQYSSQVGDFNDTHFRILRRLRSRNAGEIVGKVLGRRSGQSIGEKHLERLFVRLNNIQKLISQFVGKKDFLENMATAFEFITSNFKYQASFKGQVEKFYQSLNVGIISEGLELIWPKSQESQLTRGQFIEGLSLNNLVVREEEGFESELYVKGFRRNQ